MTRRSEWTAAICLLLLSTPIGTSSAYAADVTGNAGSAPGPHTFYNPTPASDMRDMAPDRPNVTNTPQTVDAGHIQLEEGFFDYARARSDKLSPYKSFVFGHSNFRLGVLDELELNLAIDSYDVVWNSDDGSGRSRKQSGFGDTTIGGKWNLWGNDGGDESWTTALAIQPQVKLPSARHSIGNGHTEFVVNIPLSINLIEEFHLGLQTAVADQRNQANTGYVTAWQNSASVDHVLFGLVDAYLEYATRVTTEAHRGSQQILDVGLTYPVTNNIILDSGVNLGLNASSAVTEWLMGASVRF